MWYLKGIPLHTMLVGRHNFGNTADCVGLYTDQRTRCPFACPQRSSCICCSYQSNACLRLARDPALQRAVLVYVLSAP